MGTNKNVQKLKEELFARQKAYIQTFVKNEAAKKVLDDLSKFCREKESCFEVDPRAHALLEGRREVLLRIKDHLDLKSDDLFSKYYKPKIQGD